MKPVVSYIFIPILVISLAAATFSLPVLFGTPCPNPTNQFSVENHNTNEDVKVVWCSNEYFNSENAEQDKVKGQYTVTFNQKWITLNRKYKNTMDMSTLMHELGHARGYGHTETGIMQDSDILQVRRSRTLTEETKDIATTFEGYRYINWSQDDMEYLTSEYEKGHLSEEAYNWSQMRYQNRPDSEDIYYKKSFNGFGGIETYNNNFNFGEFYTRPYEICEIHEQPWCLNR